MWRIFTITVALLLVCGVSRSAAEQQGDRQRKLESPALVALEQKVKAGDVTALDRFWSEVQRQGTPLMEPIPGDDKHTLVTFLWRGDEQTRNVVVFSAFTAGHPCCWETEAGIPGGEMSQLAGTNVWFKTIRLPSDARFTYYLSPNDSLVPWPNRPDNTDKGSPEQQPDPLNPHRFSLPHPDQVYVASLAELPGAPPFPWFNEHPDSLKGRLDEHPPAVNALGSEWNLQVYTPPGYDSSRTEPYDLLVFLGGRLFANMLHGKTILDNLILAHKIRPVVAVLLENDSLEHMVQNYGCNPQTNNFLVQKLVPWAREHYHVSAERKATTIGGWGLAGEAAAFAALRHPEVFGNVFTQDASFGWAPQAPCAGGCPVVPEVQNEAELQYEWLVRQFAASPKLPLRFSITVGQFNRTHFGYPHETPIIVANRHMKDVLLAKGYDLTYKEFSAGDEFYTDAIAAPDALSALLK